jgi:hypothetical protein
MRYLKRAGGLCVLLALLVLAAADQGHSQQPAADGTEIRDFAISVDGKQAGNLQLVITQKKDGSTHVSTKANVQVKLFLNYKYAYQGTEVWQNDQLQKLNGTCTDNNNKFTVTAELDAKANLLRVKANTKEQSIKPEVWTTSYWKLPEAKYHNKAVTLLDADRGDVIGGHLQYVGVEERTINGKSQKCFQFKIIGPNPAVDLWFDVYHRLVRQEFTDRGHRTVIELANVQR